MNRPADILVIASGNVIWPQDTVPFADEVDISDNYEDAVSCAAKLGLVMGDPQGTFRPQDALTYQEAGYLMERLKNMGIGSCAQPLRRRNLRICASNTLAATLYWSPAQRAGR